jgi:hypothetical protein
MTRKTLGPQTWQLGYNTLQITFDDLVAQTYDPLDEIAIKALFPVIPFSPKILHTGLSVSIPIVIANSLFYQVKLR